MVLLTFLWGHAHAEGCYQKAMAGAKCLPKRGETLAVVERALLGLGFFSR